MTYQYINSRVEFYTGSISYSQIVKLALQCGYLMRPHKPNELFTKLMSLKTTILNIHEITMDRHSIHPDEACRQLNC